MKILSRAELSSTIISWAAIRRTWGWSPSFLFALAAADIVVLVLAGRGGYRLLRGQLGRWLDVLLQSGSCGLAYTVAAQ